MLPADQATPMAIDAEWLRNEIQMLADASVLDICLRHRDGKIEEEDGATRIAAALVTLEALCKRISRYTGADFSVTVHGPGRCLTLNLDGAQDDEEDAE